MYSAILLKYSLVKFLDNYKMTKQSLTKSDIKKVCDILRRDDGVGANSYIDQLSWLLFLKVFEKVEEELKEITEAENKSYKNVIDQEYKWSSWATKDWKDKDELIYFINKKLFPYLRRLKGTPQKEKVGEIFRELDGNKIRSPHTLLDVIDILDEIKMKDFQDTHLLSQVYEEILQELGAEGGWAGEFYTPRPIIRLMTRIVNPKLGETILDPFTGSGGFLVESFKYIQDQNKNLDINSWRTLQTKTFFGQEKKPIPYLVGTMNLILHGMLVPNLIRTNTLMEDVLSIPEKDKVDIILTNPPFGGKEHISVQENYPIKISATEGLALQYVMRRLKSGGKCGIVLPEGQILFGTGTFKKIREDLLKKFKVTAVISLPQGVFSQMGAGVKTNLIFFEKTGSTKEIWYGEVEGKFTKKKIIQDSHFKEVYDKWKKREISENSWIISIDELKKKDFDLSPKNPNKAEEEKLPEPTELISRIEQAQVGTVSVLREIKNIL